ncbi:hypothetical protein B0T24DRAFT_300131 [Lasiosphaeria ovina]|uniref:Uncharacterized protein n=1 Tax=Lasiosphaeria ovina TaxID=92902 RepID=A0AAE0N5A3_9PEZI|nr:hypothetical protein B0T24DRAFT_300131 [Lasiosphaeria ovina]
MLDPEHAQHFAFVSYDGPRLPRDAKTRSLIRRRAMKDVAASRRQRGDYGKHNLRQFPVFVGEFVKAEPRDDAALPDGSDNDDSPTPSSTETVASAHSVTKYEQAYQAFPLRERDCGFLASLSPPADAATKLQLFHPVPRGDAGLMAASDLSMLLSLAPLTGLRLGLASLARSPWEVRNRGPDPSFLSAPRLGSSKLLAFIPSRYGQVATLTHATDCVVAKLRHMMVGQGGGEADVLGHYTKALRALQVALDDEEQRFTPETLCATQLLAVYELLSADGKPVSWIRHVGGATRLIEVRGVDRFKSEFDLALLTAHAGPAVTEAFLNNKSCFLAEDAWLRVLRAAISGDASLARQMDLVLALWGHLVGGPHVFEMTTALVCAPSPPPQGVVDDLVERLLGDRARLLVWLGMAQQRIGLRMHGSYEDDEMARDVSAFPAGEDESEDDGTHLALRGTYTTCRILKARLLVALAPARFRHLEAECQELAGRVMRLGDQQPSAGRVSGSLVGSLFMSQSSWIAKAIVETRDVWAAESAGSGMIERAKFEAWCRAIGRKVPDS